MGRAANFSGISHEDHFQRHGSYHKGSYSAAELRSYRLAAERWLQGNGQDPYAQAALKAVEAL